MLWSSTAPVDNATAAASPQVCNGVLTNALPLHTAPKKVQKGMPALPHTSPQRSNKPLGTAANTKILIKTCDSSICPSIADRVLATKTDVHDLFFLLLPPSKSSDRGSGTSGSSSKANGSPPAALIILAKTNGSISPTALPVPDQKPGMATAHIRSENELVSSEEELWPSDHSTASLHVAGNRKRAPVCTPLPNPAVDRTPQPNQNAASNVADTSHSAYWLGSVSVSCNVCTK
mmetsp:Transcript_20199/g.44084  ORF Transcript_20199/g.44084 Transcript_20199/m.44084 type:complete len:233 (-) Transcript_20199:868-1566(-)